MDTTSKTTVERLHEILGGKCYALKRKTHADRPVFRWESTGALATGICRMLHQYLVEKSKQAELLGLFNRFPPNSAMRDSLKARLSDLKRTV